MLEGIYIDLDRVTKGLQRFNNGSYPGGPKEEMFLEETLFLLARRLSHSFI